LHKPYLSNSSTSKKKTTKTATTFKGNFQHGEVTEPVLCLIHPRLRKTFNERDKNTSLSLYPLAKYYYSWKADRAAMWWWRLTNHIP